MSFPKLHTGVNYDTVMDRQVGDKRFEREKAYKGITLSLGATSSSKPISSTFDAFQRMAAGLEGRSVADKLSDPNRPTWEQYKKENEQKLDLSGGEVRKMVEYRAQLDQERDRRLKDRKRELFVEYSDDESKGSGRKKSKKHKKEKTKHKKHHKGKKHHDHDDAKKKRKKQSSSDDEIASSKSSQSSRDG